MTRRTAWHRKEVKKLTVREKALERLIMNEAMKIQSELIHEYTLQLNKLNDGISKNTSSNYVKESDIKDYHEIATKLHALVNTNCFAFLDSDYSL